jgi:DNA-binding protein HU-beta
MPFYILTSTKASFNLSNNQGFSTQQTLIKWEGTMTKAELVDKIAKEAGISKVAAAAALNSFMDGVTKTLKKKDGKVTLVGFGTFAKVRRKARTGRNPQTGAPIKIKARNVVKFKPGKTLKDAV